MLPAFNDTVAVVLPLYTCSAAVAGTAIQGTVSTTVRHARSALRFSLYCWLRVFLLELNLPTDLTVVLPASSDCTLRLLFLVWR